MVVITDKTIMLLKLYVEDHELRNKYLDKCFEHNTMVDEDEHYNAGFDLFVPYNVTIEGHKTTMLDMGVKTAGYWMDENDVVQAPCGFTLYPRSSICKTPLRLANSVGVIDSGYRGNIKAAVDCNAVDEYMVEKNTRLVQICSPFLGRIKAIVVTSETELGNTTRGVGGFGSTGQ